MCPYCRKRDHGTPGRCMNVAHEETLCTCSVALTPSAIDECRRCYRPVFGLLNARYGWSVIP